MWLHLILETSCFCTGWLLLGPCLVSDTLSFDPMSHSKFLSLFLSSFFFGVSYWLGISILFQGWCNSLIVSAIQLFDKFPKLLIIAFKIYGGCFGFASFYWNASVCLCNLNHIYNIIMAVLKLIKYSCVSDVPCSSLSCKCKSQKQPCTMLCVCHFSINCNN